MGCSIDFLKETNPFRLVCNKMINLEVTKKLIQLYKQTIDTSGAVTFAVTSRNISLK